MLNLLNLLQQTHSHTNPTAMDYIDAGRNPPAHFVVFDGS